MTAEQLRARTRKDLAQLAKKHDVLGWHAMRKDALVKALVSALRTRKNRVKNRAASSKTRAANGRGVLQQQTSSESQSSTSAVRRNGRTRNGSSRAATGRRIRKTSTGGRNSRGTSAGVARRNGSNGKSRQASGGNRSHLNASKLLHVFPPNGTATDHFTAVAHDSYWIHARWSISQTMIDRAEAALGTQWRQAFPVIRVFDVTTDDLATEGKTWIQDIEIHTAVDNWFIPVENPPRTFGLHLGYLTPDGQFFAIARSLKVKTRRERKISSSRAGRINGHNGRSGKNGDSSSNSTTQESTLVVRSAGPALSSQTSRGTGNRSSSEFPFELRAELIVHGRTHSQAELTLLGEPVPLAEDGTFAVQLALPNGRQVIPAVVVTPKGNEQRTIVLGIECNMKELEPRNLEELT